VLPTIKYSRNALLRIAQEKTVDLFYELKAAHVVAIVENLALLRDYPVSLLETISRWLDVHLHTVTDIDLICIVPAFSRASYVDESMKKSIRRYVKTRRNLVSEAQVMTVLANYCKRVRWRDAMVLDKFGEYFAANAHKLSPVQVKALVELFGLFAYPPANSFEVFEALENVLRERFAQFKPGDVLDILLGCVFIQRYPLNFIKKVSFHRKSISVCKYLQFLPYSSLQFSFFFS
jgi:hypothetical protein